MECTANNSKYLIPWIVPHILRKPSETMVLLYFQPVICSIGLLLNFVYIFVVLRSKVLHTITHTYLINLAVSDCIYLMYSCVYGLLEQFYSDLRNNVAFLGRGGCIYTTVISYTCYFTSLLLVSVVTTERYLAICRPLLHRGIASRGRTRKLILFCWIISACLATSMLIQYGYQDEDCRKFTSEFSHLNLPAKFAACRVVPTLKPAIYIHFQPLVECGTFIITFVGKKQYRNLLIKTIMHEVCIEIQSGVNWLSDTTTPI